MTEANTVEPDDTPSAAADPSQDTSADQRATPDSGEAEGDLARLKQERDEYYDRLLRKGAEFENYRKRIDKERREHSEWAAADVLGEIVSVLDDFDRALAADAPPEAQPYRAGVELIRRQLGELLRKRGVTPIDALGADFDPHLHQAVAYDETPGAREGEVVDELRKGYRLGDRLLRPAMVRVAKAS